MKKLLYATTACVVLAAAAFTAVAQDRHEQGDRQHRGGPQQWRHGGFGDPERMVEMLTRRLDLDATQSQTIDNILTAAKPEMDALRERLKAGKSAMRELDVDAADYGSQLQNLSTEIGAMTSEATLLFGRLRADVAGVLTPEQREQAAAAMSGMRDHSRSHRRRDKE